MHTKNKSNHLGKSVLMFTVWKPPEIPKGWGGLLFCLLLPFNYLLAPPLKLYYKQNLN